MYTCLCASSGTVAMTLLVLHLQKIDFLCDIEV